MHKVLIIEDDLLILKSLASLLQFSGYEVITALNGFDGIKLATTELPDIILSDINMPEKTGLDVLFALKQDSMTASIPFIFITARADKEDIRIGMSMGAEDYITKPFKNSDIINSIETRLKKRSLIDGLYQNKLNEFRKNLSMMLPHEFRTPITSLIGFSDLILMEYETIDREELKMLVEHINSSSKRIFAVISRYIFYSKLLIELSDKSNYIKGCSYITKEIIEEHFNSIAVKYNRESDLIFNLIDFHEIDISNEYLNKLIDEIADNSFKFSFSNSKITISTYIENNYFVFSVRNFGRGFSIEEIKDIGAFVQFKRDMFEQQGIGLGLTIIKMIIELHNGILEIKSEINNFAEIIIKIPIK